MKTAVEIVTSTDVNIAEDTSEREVIEKAAYEFHKGLAEQIVAACVHAAEKPDAGQPHLVAVYFRMDYCFV